MNGINYGILVGKFKKIKLTQMLKNKINKKRKKVRPHYNFILDVNNVNYEVNINVQSSDVTAPELKIFVASSNEQLNNTKPFELAQKLENGVYSNVDQELKLDYLRGNYFDLNQLQIPKNMQEGEIKYLFDFFNEQMQIAKDNDYQIVVWGEIYVNKIGMIIKKQGIHDVHMNQGSISRFAAENGIWQDGGLAIFDNEKKLKFMIFLAFSSQCLQTDDHGNCISKN